MFGYSKHLSSLSSSRRHPGSRQASAVRLKIESLEQRLVPSVSPPSGSTPLVIPNAQVEAVYWGQAWDSWTPPPPAKPGVAPAFNALQDMSELNTCLGTITADDSTGSYMYQLRQYGVETGTFLGGEVQFNGPAANATVTETQITNMLQRGDQQQPAVPRRTPVDSTWFSCPPMCTTSLTSPTVR